MFPYQFSVQNFNYYLRACTNKRELIMICKMKDGGCKASVHYRNGKIYRRFVHNHDPILKKVENKALTEEEGLAEDVNSDQGSI